MRVAEYHNGLFRQGVEALVYLGLTVILFRAFAVEGYMISTGSMAPCLLGYHRRVVCPSCSFVFSRGTHFDEDDTILAAGRPASDLSGDDVAPATVCPNCGLAAIDASHIPRNEGDQLLVHKHLYQIRSPRRWEVVVFRHPSEPDQAYVKRVVGLPGESIEILDGDVYVNGELQRKPLETQRSMRISVFDHDHVPADADCQTRWQAEDGGRWAVYHDGFVHRQSHEVDDADRIDWLTYHHWVREGNGGANHASVTLAELPADAARALLLDSRLVYDDQRRELSYDGVLPHHTAYRLRRQSNDAAWTAAIGELEQRSHEVPIVDQYGYNHPSAGDGPLEVHDLMLEAVVRRVQGEGDWRMQMSDGWRRFELIFDMARREVRLMVDGETEPVRTGRFPDAAFTEETTVELSLFDRQVLAAVDGVVLFQPLRYAAETTPRRLTGHPVQLGACGLDVQLSHLRLYRDVHYTPKHAAGRTGGTWELGADEFFMLGDNSPVSLDSRAWESPAIPRRLLIGKPFLVHLPSQQERVEFAGTVHHIRIPDFTRVRYIR